MGAQYDEPQPVQIKRAVNLICMSSFFVIAGIFLIGKVAIIGY
jgi:hypothetical protein